MSTTQAEAKAFGSETKNLTSRIDWGRRNPSGHETHDNFPVQLSGPRHDASTSRRDIYHHRRRVHWKIHEYRATTAAVSSLSFRRDSGSSLKSTHRHTRTHTLSPFDEGCLLPRRDEAAPASLSFPAGSISSTPRRSPLLPPMPPSSSCAQADRSATHGKKKKKKTQ